MSRLDKIQVKAGFAFAVALVLLQIIFLFFVGFKLVDWSPLGVMSPMIIGCVAEVAIQLAEYTLKSNNKTDKAIGVGEGVKR